jgi:hypothetical protein
MDALRLAGGDCSACCAPPSGVIAPAAAACPWRPAADVLAPLSLRAKLSL